MSDIRVASRYAKSLLELAAEQKVLDAVHKDMVSFVKVCEETRDFYLMLKNPVIKHDKKRAILNKVFGKANKLTLAIFDIITRKNRESILLEIAKQFDVQYNVHMSIERASVTTAVPLDKELKKQLEDLVNKISKLDKVDLIEKIDEEIIGGFILKVGDRQIDDSLRTKLKALDLKFSQNPYIKEF
ncbi:MAG: ATP synthase F1 subunit delta [Fulvivirga sp.]|uniref:ATP synthase F1 subunit delta n=1 Tax=Fulvivirga sp. TaxID=1931237 RepID=UPI0032EF7D88